MDFAERFVEVKAVSVYLWSRVRDYLNQWWKLFFGRPSFEQYQSNEVQCEQYFDEFSKIYR